MKLKHIIFDFDGTLADSEALHFKGWNETLKPYNVQLDDFEHYLKTYAGIPTPANAKSFIDMFNLPMTVEEFSEKREHTFHTLLKAHEPEFMPYAIETLNFFKDRGYPLYLVTGSPRLTIDIIFEKTGLNKYFEFEVTRSDVTHSKPHPESYITAIEKIGDTPESMIVFEDTNSGVTAAKAANLRCFAVQHDVEAHANLNAADKIFTNLKDATDFLETTDLLNNKD
ncbi:HAD family hydrolase [Neptunitalea lumnitzerae]|uniref:Beta-phosphoglucomutase n=1 Tax=Neptunitalea lumnitzerae TaxID=2965509 RepID=A0ABQ5MES2_9FLAO|nr:HAD family phosphatase [Neptunitalea sp. Y10]GLB47871.1 beta-phosphoglucomutase [Neptunitalea sp. Y10]